MKLFIRTDREVIEDAIKLSRPSFIEKYKDTTATEETLKEAYHQLRVYHVKSTTKPLPSSMPRALREVLDVTIDDPSDAIVTTSSDEKPPVKCMKVEINKKTKVTENKTNKKAPEVKKTKAAGNKKEAVLALLKEGKSVKETMQQLQEEGIKVSYTYTNKLKKSLK